MGYYKVPTKLMLTLALFEINFASLKQLIFYEVYLCHSILKYKNV
jgi:hypothetical protein